MKRLVLILLFLATTKSYSQDSIPFKIEEIGENISFYLEQYHSALNALEGRKKSIQISETKRLSFEKKLNRCIIDSTKASKIDTIKIADSLVVVLNCKNERIDLLRQDTLTQKRNEIDSLFQFEQAKIVLLAEKKLEEQKSKAKRILAGKSGKISFEYNGHRYRSFVYSNKSHKIQMHHRDKSNNIYSSLSRVHTSASKKNGGVVMLTNGGMYTSTQEPEGLFVENGIEKYEMDTLNIPNLNFYMMPNGVFYVDRFGVPRISVSNAFRKDSLVKYATQSGPMLIINGEYHPKFNFGAPSKKIRSGVGLLDKDRCVFIISDDPVNFYEFGTVFKFLFGSDDALFLDGAISKMYIGDRNDLGGNFGVIISISEK